MRLPHHWWFQQWEGKERNSYNLQGPPRRNHGQLRSWIHHRFPHGQHPRSKNPQRKLHLQSHTNAQHRWSRQWKLQMQSRLSRPQPIMDWPLEKVTPHHLSCEATHQENEGRKRSRTILRHTWPFKKKKYFHVWLFREGPQQKRVNFPHAQPKQLQCLLLQRLQLSHPER